MLLKIFQTFGGDMGQELLAHLGLLNPGAGWLEIAVFTVAAGALIVAASVWTDNFWIVVGDGIVTPREWAFYKSLYLEYPVWGTLQQLLVFWILYLLRFFLPPEIDVWAPPIAALVFALMHLPNFYLMFTVGFMVSIFVVHMEIHHNVYAIGIAHGVLGTLWKFLPPAAVSTGFEVWGKYACVQKALQADLKKVGYVAR